MEYPICSLLTDRHKKTKGSVCVCVYTEVREMGQLENLGRGDVGVSLCKMLVAFCKFDIISQ